MNAAEWTAASDPATMLEAVEDRVSDRKLRLFAVACCRHAWNTFVDPFSVRVVLAAEAFADGELTVDELARVYAAAVEADGDGATGSNYAAHVRRAAAFAAHPSRPARAAAAHAALAVADMPADLPQFPPPPRSEGYDVYRGERAAQAGLLRDVVGDPDRPAALDPRWLTSTALSLARAVYAGRAFDRLPVLADALEEAGCDRPDILAHLRDADRPHARGCWAVDLVLGKP